MARHEITLKKVVYHIPAADAVTVRKDIPYQATAEGDLTMDVYYPPDMKSAARNPAVVLVIGYSDIGARAILGCAASEMESSVGWARLIAASGPITVTYRTGREPAADVRAALHYVRQQSASLMIDETRIGIWAALLRHHAGSRWHDRRRRGCEDVPIRQRVSRTIGRRSFD